MVGATQEKPAREGKKGKEFLKQQQEGAPRELRRNLTKLLRETKDDKHELAADVEKLLGRLHASNSLCDSVSRATDASLDSEVLTILAKGGAELIRKAARGSVVKHSLDDYTRRLKRRYGDEGGVSTTFQWDKLARKRFSSWFRPAPATSHMLGPMSLAPTQKKRQVTKRKAKRVVSGEGVRPDEMEELEDVLHGEEGMLKETDRNMETMYRVLGQCPENKALMMELCINHESFSQTVENIFTLSFLVRDGRVAFRKTDEGIEVRKVTKEQTRAADGTANGRMQFVMSLSIAEWKEWCAAVAKPNALMPNRADAEGDAGEARKNASHTKRRTKN